MRQQPERVLAIQVAQYLQLQYPGALYRFDLAADLKLSMGQAARHKRLHPRRGFPDLLVLTACCGYLGLAIELKADGVKVYKADGSLYADPHLQEQSEYLQDFRDKGYRAEFAIGFEAARTLISGYFAGTLQSSAKSEP